MDEFLRDLAAERHERYVEGRGTPDLAKAQVGPVFSVVLDRRTGNIYEGTNAIAPDRPPSDLHPMLQERLDRMTEQSQAHPAGYEYPGGDRGPFPHFSVPGTHAEVQAVDRALRDREAAGMPVEASHLGELTVQSRFLEGPKRGGDAAAAPTAQRCSTGSTTSRASARWTR